MNPLYLIVTVILFTLGRYQATKSKENDVLLTSWITHLGCFMGSSLNENTLVKTIRYETRNEPRTCSRHCRNWSYFALWGNRCYCFPKDVFGNMIETVNNRCYFRCPNTDGILYCGSTVKGYYTIYERNTDFKVNGSSNCVARMKGRDTLQSLNCDTELKFICKTPAGVKIQTKKYSFYKAKLFCENNGGRLAIFTENMPPKSAVNEFYWTGTFRQDIKKNTHYERTTNYPSSSSKSTIISTTLRYIGHTTPLDSQTTEVQVTKETTLGPNTSPNNIDVNIFDASSQKLKDRGDGEDENELDCGIFCFVFGVCFCCVAILALVVCLFKIRQQWNVRVQKSITVTHTTKVNPDDDSKENPDDKEAKERIPVYLDPATQTVFFRNLDNVHQHIYDQADIYNKTSQIPVRTKCVSGYQELQFTDKGDDKITNDPVLTKDEKSDVNYHAPWDISKGRAKDRHVKSDVGKQTNRNDTRELHSSIIQTKNVHSENLQYEDIVINHKNFLYDEPQQIANQLRIKKYPSSIIPNVKPASDRGIGGWNSPVSNIKVTSSQPDIITNTYDDRIYETPISVDREEFAKTEKPQKHKSRSVKLKIFNFSKSLRKYRKRRTSVDVDRTYAIPNPVNPALRVSKVRSVGATNVTSGQKSLMKYPPTSFLNNSHLNIHSDKTNRKSFQYDLATPIGIKPTGDHLCRENHGALQNELAIKIKEKPDNTPEDDKDNVPIYFEPMK